MGDVDVSNSNNNYALYSNISGDSDVMTHSLSKEALNDGSYAGYSTDHSDQMGYLGPNTGDDTNDDGNEAGDRKEMSELDKYWKAVRETPQDFTGWTYLLQYVEQENDLIAAREAFDAFFKCYPYCYGYWKKYADLEKKNIFIDRCQEVFERGVAAIPLSIDLWQHYISFFRTQYPGSEYEEKTRSLHERSVQAAGLEFRSDRLWEIYIQYEIDCKNPRNAMAIYDRLISTPTQLYSHHYEKFEEFVRDNYPKDILSAEEFLALRTEYLKTQKPAMTPLSMSLAPEGATSESEETNAAAVDNSASESEDAKEEIDAKSEEEEAIAIRDKIIELRRVKHKANEEEVSRRWNFEEGIKRPYFHVKPLERAQLKNWRDYLDFEVENGSHERVVILFERCMIACALYEDLWLRFAKYMEAFGEDGPRSVYERACSIHLPQKPNIHLARASYEEKSGNFSKAMEALNFLEKMFPTYLPAKFRRLGLVRRTGKREDVEALFKKYIDTASVPNVASLYAIKQARYRFKVCGDIEGAKKVLNAAIENDKDNPKLYLQLVDICYQTTPVDEEAVVTAFDAALEGDANLDTKLLLAQRKVEFLEDLGCDVVRLQEAYNDLSKLTRTGAENRKRVLEDGSEDTVKDKRLKMELNGVAAVTAVPAAATAAQADPAAYNYNWAGYAQNYNYQTAWNVYNQQYYPQQ